MAHGAPSLGSLAVYGRGWTDKCTAVAYCGLVKALSKCPKMGKRREACTGVARSRTVRSCRGAGGVSIERYSVAMARSVDECLANHLRRKDGNEDLCLALYMPSTGVTRFTALITELVLPEDGDRVVSGRVEFCGDYVLRAASKAADIGGGVAILHSHPNGKGWQSLSTFDRDAELSFAVLAMEVTGLPLVGMTYACIDSAWSARFWLTYPYGAHDTPCESVRVIGNRLAISWNSALAPVPSVTTRLTRTVSCWGEATQAEFCALARSCDRRRHLGIGYRATVCRGRRSAHRIAGL